MTVTDNSYYFGQGLGLGCQIRGFPNGGTCFCQDGYSGNFCEIQCFDEKCIRCSNYWATNKRPACETGTTGYLPTNNGMC